MDLAILLIHYRTPALAAEAVAALRRDLESSRLEADLVIVDNGSDAEGRALLASLPARLLEPGENVGYAGGINRGVAATSAPLLVAMNPDVLVEPGCLAALVEPLRKGAAVAGPRFFLDRGKRLMIPPTERRRPSSEILAVLSTRGEPWTSSARRSWRRHAFRHWKATEPLASRSLSGALLAFTRDAVARAGPFDEGYRLYFEEDDWLHRVAENGLETLYVPAAEAVHLHAQSTLAEPRAGEWFAASRARFEDRHFHPLLTRLLRRLAPGSELVVPWPPELPRGVPRFALAEVSRASLSDSVWVELATSARGFPCAAERVPDGVGEAWELPGDVWAGLLPGRYVLQLVDDHGVELSRRSFHRPEGGA